MNLTAMFKEGSLVDHRWWETGMVKPGEITFDPEAHDVKNPNNVKPEAQDQWGYGDISPIFDDPTAGEVDRMLPERAYGDAGPVIIFARDMMNAGAPLSAVKRELKAKYPQELLVASNDELQKLLDMDGVIGRVAVDARGYKSCEQALMRAAHSPYKHFIKFVIGCSCGDPHMVQADNGSKIRLVESSGNGIDDFFGSSEPATVRQAMVPHCNSTHVRMFESSMDDLDEEWMDDTMIDIVNLAGLPEDESQRIRVLDAQPLEKVREAFRTLDRLRSKRAKVRYSEPVDASEHIIHAADNEIELMAAPVPFGEIDGTNPAIQHTIIPDPEPELVQVGDVDLLGEMSDINLSEPGDQSQLDVLWKDTGEVYLEPEKIAPSPLEVDSLDGEAGAGMEFPSILDEVPVELGEAPTGFFEDADVIELDPEKTPAPALDIEMNGEMEW